MGSTAPFMIVCSTDDAACQALAETWSAEHAVLLAAKHTRGFAFDAEAYQVYWIAPSSVAAAAAGSNAAAAPQNLP